MKSTIVKKMILLAFAVSVSACMLFSIGAPKPTDTSSAPALIPTQIATTVPPLIPTNPGVTESPTAKPILMTNGPFTHIMPLDQALFGVVLDFKPVPGSDFMLLTTTQGTAMLMNDSASIQLAQAGPVYAGADDLGRMWFLEPGIPTNIYYVDSSNIPHDANQGWLPVDPIDDLAGKGVVTDAAGNIWLATTFDVRRFDGSSWQSWSLNDLVMIPPEFEDLYHDLQIFTFPNSDTVWVASCHWGGPGPMGGSGVRWFDGQTWEGWATPADNGCVNDITQDQNGNIWMGIEHSLWEFSPASGHWQNHPFLPESEQVHFAFAADIVVSPVGEPWVSFDLCGGASCGNHLRYRYHNGAWQQVGELTYRPDRLIFDANGTAWLFDAGAIYRFEGDERVEVATLYTHAAALDTLGNLWVIASQKGEPIGVWRMQAPD